MGTSILNVAGQLDSQLEHRVYYCRLPYSQYPSFGKELSSFEEDEINEDGKMETIRKSEMEFDGRCQEILSTQGVPYGSRIILPQSLMRSCIVPDITNMESSPATASTNPYYYQSKYYTFKSVTNLQPGKNVFWYHPKSGFHLGKVHFTGIDTCKFSKQERNKPSDLTVFVSFVSSNNVLCIIPLQLHIDEGIQQQNLITELNGMDIRIEMGIRKYIYPIEWVHLISFSDFAYLVELTNVADLKYEMQEAGVVEVKHSNHAKNSTDSCLSKPLNEKTSQKAPYELTRTPTPSTSKSNPQPLTKSRLSDDPQFCDSLEIESLAYVLNSLTAQTPRLHLNGEMPPACVEVDKKPVTKMKSSTQHISTSDSWDSHKLTFKKAKLNADETIPSLPEQISPPKNKTVIGQKHVNKYKNKDRERIKCTHENFQGSSKRLISKGFLEEKIDPPIHEFSANQGINYQVEEGREENFVKAPISYNHALSADRMKLITLGIQGFNNSCYADSVLFSLFAFTNVFDHCLKSPRVSEDSALSTPNKAITNILKYDVVSVLRSNGYLPSDAVQKLRQAMEIHNANFVGSFMDAEDFILTLFGEILDVPKFHVFDNNAEDYVFQIHVMFEGEKNTNASLQVLLERSLEEIDVKLCGIPFPAFIVKLPVCNGKSLFEKVQPNLTICLDQVLSVESLKTTESKTQMLLRAVICLNKEHYTSFVRTAYDKYSDWLYFDSKPTSKNHEIFHIPYLSELLENPEKAYTKSSPCYDPDGYFDFLMRNAYICIYEPINVQETIL
ncbi:unnamed protein product [Orchesella dallaii]|uniref:USP domain-containing protein n=1 Tax=Orchesella dallaii TaxID=48710 RepID=A0ABP1QIH3_9HEXA